MKTAIVTGSTKGIGKACVEKFLAEGFFVVGAARGISSITHKNYLHHRLDVGSSNEVLSFYEKIKNHLGETEVLINNAGIGWPTPLEKTEIDAWDEIIQTNVNGVYYMTQPLINYLIKAKRGHIINISSTAGKQGIEAMSAYCASKFAVRGLSQSWYKELRPHGVKVTSIHPGSVNTNFFDPFENVEANDSYMHPKDVANSIWHAYNSPDNYHMVELEMRPLQPR